MNNVCYCLDCEWTGPQSKVNMKWGKRFCPRCKSRRVELRTVEPVHDADIDYALMARLAGDLGDTDL